MGPRLERAVAAGQLTHSREDGLALHALALRAARGTGPQELAVGEGLDVLVRRGMLPRLGRSGVGDVGREDLGPDAVVFDFVGKEVVVRARQALPARAAA